MADGFVAKIMANGMVDIPALAESLAQQIRRLGPSVSVTHSGSAAGRSSYLRVTGLQDEIRVSDHAKGTFNSQFITWMQQVPWRGRVAMRPPWMFSASRSRRSSH